MPGCGMHRKDADDPQSYRLQLTGRVRSDAQYVDCTYPVSRFEEVQFELHELNVLLARRSEHRGQWGED
eukprot:IDg17866t1